MDQFDDNWFAEDSFWEQTYPFMFPESRFWAGSESIPKIASLTGKTSGEVLDLACGPGRTAIPFALAGYQVTGVDRTEFLLKQGKIRAAALGASVEWVHRDMREFIRPASFDLAVNLFTSFGYFDDANDNKLVLQNVFASLRPDGVFVIDHLGKELLASRLQATTSEQLPDGTILFQQAQVIDDWSRVSCDWTILKEGRATPFRVCHWLYSGQELRDLLRSAGFKEVSLFGSLDQSPYDTKSQRLIAVAKKSTT